VKRRRDSDKPARQARRLLEKASVEIELAGGGRVPVSGEAAAQVLERLIDTLCRR
jgi:hypothetical protein